MSISIVANSSISRLRKSSKISDPELVGYYSVDADRNYLPDSSRLLYYNPPSQENVRLDLNHGIETAVRSSGPSRDAEYMFKWIKENRNEIQASPETNRWINPNFVCNRNLLVTLLGTPVLWNEPWWIRAAKWKGNIYLSFDNVEKINYISRDELAKFASWGCKFEQYILSDDPDKAPDVSKPVVESNQFRCMYQRRFGSQTVLFSVAMKGVCSKKPLRDPLPLKDLQFIDLKTSKIIENNQQKRRFRKYKLFKWWAQNFLTDTRAVLCGFKDDEGIVRHLKSFSLNEISKMSEGWNPRTCIDFCESILAWISKVVVNDCDRTVYRFKREKYADCVKVTELLPTRENTPYWLME